MRNLAFNKLIFLNIEVQWKRCHNINKLLPIEKHIKKRYQMLDEMSVGNVTLLTRNEKVGATFIRHNKVSAHEVDTRRLEFSLSSNQRCYNRELLMLRKRHRP